MFTVEKQKLNRVKRGTIVDVYTHCVEFTCPRCGNHAVGEGYLRHNKKGEPMVSCFRCHGGPYKAKQMPL